MTDTLHPQTEGFRPVLTVSQRRPVLAAIADIREGVGKWWIWWAMAWRDIRQRYRGSMLGPFWLTISMAIMIAVLGTLYSTLMKVAIEDYLPYLCLGLLFWTTTSTLITDGCVVFVNSDTIILQTRMPLTVHVMRSLCRNFIIFGHNCLVGVAVLFLFEVPQSLYSLVSLFGLLLIYLNGFWVALLFGMLCARFRDVGQIVSSFTQILFFVTPILWHPAALGFRHWMADLNPVYAVLEIARAPLLGAPISPNIWKMALATTVIGWIVAFLFFARYRARIAYWL